MAKSKKKKAEPGSVESVAALMEVVMGDTRSGSGMGRATSTFTADKISGRYRYIDFIDPLLDNPCPALEDIFGARGILTGRMMKIEAEPSVGKSSLCYLLYAMAQRQKGFAIHFDAEQTPPPEDYIARFGADPRRVMMNLPKRIDVAFDNILHWFKLIRGSSVMGHSLDPRLNPQAEIHPDASAAERKLIEAARKLLESEGKIAGEDPSCEGPILMGVDSISSLSGDVEDVQEFSASNKGVGLHARLTSKFFRDNTHLLEPAHALLLMVSQIREGIDMGGFKEKGLKNSSVTGIAQRPLDFHSSYTVRLSKHNVGDYVAGQPRMEGMRIMNYKGKVSGQRKHYTSELMVPYFRDGGFNLHQAGIDWMFSISGQELGGGEKFVATAAGGHIKCPTLSDKTFGRSDDGKYALYAEFLKNKELLDAIRNARLIRGYGLPFETAYQAKFNDSTLPQAIADTQKEDVK